MFRKELEEEFKLGIKLTIQVMEGTLKEKNQTQSVDSDFAMSSTSPRFIYFGSVLTIKIMRIT